jgi:UDP-glucose 4-epimerase
VFHLAASPDVRTGVRDPRTDFEQNLVATRNLLEAMRMSESGKNLVFASTSTVYGEAKSIPTHEDYGPMMPVSLYGATKLGCEALIMAYCHLFDMRAVIYRFANIVGPRSRHGVIYDFIEKLRSDCRELEVLGDGTQSKSYMVVDDCVEAFLFGHPPASDRVEVFNIGSDDMVDVKTIARIVIEEMGLSDVKLRFAAGVEGRGWPGDVKEMQLEHSLALAESEHRHEFR